MRQLLSIVAAAVSSLANAQIALDPNCGGDTREVNQCFVDALSKADTSLNAIYKLLLAELSSGSNIALLDFNERKRSLLAAERAWVNFKKAQCWAVYVDNSPGSGASAASMSCQLDLTNERIRFLKDYEANVGPDSNLCIADSSKCHVP